MPGLRFRIRFAEVLAMGARLELPSGAGDGFYEAVVACSPTAVIVLDVEGRVRFVNERAMHLLGGRELVGWRFADLFGPEHGPAVAGYVAGLVQAPAATTMFLAADLDTATEREAQYIHVHGRNLINAAGVRGLLLTLLDGTEARRREADLEHRALYDSLTGLPNRTLLMERLSQACEHGSRAGALLMVDLDGFKQVNDRLGHARGDALLIQVAGRLKQAAPTSATVARLGGDEFAVLLPETTLDVAGKIAAAFCEEIAAPYVDVADPITASIGVAETRLIGVDALRDADVAMYAAKVGGRNQAIVYGPDVREALRLDPSQPRHDASHFVRALRDERDRLHAEARTDALTAVPNRRALDETLASFSDPADVSVLFVDLDRFSAYNHQHGDAQGDETLRMVASTLVGTCRDGDAVFRKGGEEFVVLLPRTGAEAAAAAAERVRAAVEALGLEHGGHEQVPVVTVTVGAATCDDGDLNRAMKHAGHAAYASKVAGRRNCVAPFKQ